MYHFPQMSTKPPQGNYMVASCPPQTSYDQVVCEQPNMSNFYNPYHQTVVNGHVLAPQDVILTNGLYNLVTVDKLIVKQHSGNFGELTGFKDNKKYTIRNGIGQTIYYAVEENKCCAQTYCGALHGFEMQIMDQYGNEVIHLSKPYVCQSCLIPCSSEKIEVFSPVGCFVGSVEKGSSCFRSIYTVRNEVNDEVLKIKKPFGVCGSGVEFKVFSKENVEVGRASKQLSGLPKEFFPSELSDSRYFGITFHKNLNVSVKAVMMGACFLMIS